MNLYTAFAHPHLLFVILFLLIYLVKTGLLISGKDDALTKVSKYLRIPEMVVSFGFLATGIGLATQIPTEAWSVLLIVKLVLVFASIPLAVIGFKRKNKILAAVAFLFIVGSYGLAESHKKRAYIGEQVAAVGSNDPASEQYDQLAHGKALYTANCIACHGTNGALQAAGAANLQVSELSREEVHSLVTNGKLNMPAYGKALSEEEIEAVAAYAMSLKK